MISGDGFERLLSALVSLPTVSADGNLAAVELLEEHLRRGGLTTHRQDADDRRNANLVAWAGPEPTPERPGLTLCGHLDVVPAAEEGWQSDPFSLADTGDSWRGRGTADMKGFVALAVELASERAKDDLRAPLALLFTHGEEIGSFGARQFVDSWPGPPLPRSVVIGEPTRLRTVRLHKGHLRMRATFRGRAAHSGHPREGRSAIEPAARAVVELSELRHQLEAERPESAAHFPETPFVALNVARIEGGRAINVIPDRCTIEIGARPLPGTDVDTLTARIRDRIATTGAQHEFELLHESPPMQTPEEASVHRRLRALTGQTASESADFSSDGGFLSRAGYDCVLFGPGDITVAHRANEFLPKRDVAAARDLLRCLIQALCVENDA